MKPRRSTRRRRASSRWVRSTLRSRRRMYHSWCSSSKLLRRSSNEDQLRPARPSVRECQRAVLATARPTRSLGGRSTRCSTEADAHLSCPCACRAPRGCRGRGKMPRAGARSCPCPARAATAPWVPPTGFRKRSPRASAAQMSTPRVLAARRTARARRQRRTAGATSTQGSGWRSSKGSWRGEVALRKCGGVQNGR